MKKDAIQVPSRPYSPYTALDRILERVLDLFDELEGLDSQDYAEILDRTLANLAVLKHRIAAALFLFGDTRRAYLLGFPENPESQRVALEQCAGDMPSRFVAVYTASGATHQEERMALCLLQAEVEFRHHLARELGDRVTLVSVRHAEELSEE